MYKHLYENFKHWYHGGNIWFYSDPHFGDIESYKIRFPKEFDFDNNSDRPSDDWVVNKLDQIQIDNINKKVRKNDTLIILGDVGDLECIRRLKADYKVLIMGNHDLGASNYQRRIGYLDKSHLGEDKKYHYIEKDNKLFDEVYEGTLQISPKIILSHEPIEYKYCLNVHGHVHPCRPLTELDLPYYELITADHIYKYYNCCAEYLNYTPICLKSIVESGVLKHITDIHRETIDKASSVKGV